MTSNQRCCKCRHFSFNVHVRCFIKARIDRWEKTMQKHQRNKVKCQRNLLLKVQPDRCEKENEQNTKKGDVNDFTEATENIIVSYCTFDENLCLYWLFCQSFHLSASLDFMSIYGPVCPFVCLFCLSVRLYTCLSVSVSVRLFKSLSLSALSLWLCPSVSFRLSPSIRLCPCISVRLYICPSVTVPLYLSLSVTLCLYYPSLNVSVRPSVSLCLSLSVCLCPSLSLSV